MKHSNERIAFIASKKSCYVYNNDDLYFLAISCVEDLCFCLRKTTNHKVTNKNVTTTRNVTHLEENTGVINQLITWHINNRYFHNKSQPKSSTLS